MKVGGSGWNVYILSRFYRLTENEEAGLELNYAFSDMNFKCDRGELPEGETRTAAANDSVFEQFNFSNRSVK